MWTYPDNFLPEDETLLGEDFDKLGAADASDQACWIAKMESALMAAVHGRKCKSFHINQQFDPPTASRCPAAHTPHAATANDAPIIDTEGSIHYRRRRKKYITDNSSSIETDYAGKLN